MALLRLSSVLARSVRSSSSSSSAVVDLAPKRKSLFPAPALLLLPPRRGLATSSSRSAAPWAPEPDSGWHRWRNVFVFLAIPALALAHANVFLLKSGPDPSRDPEEWDEENQRPVFKQYTYLRLHSKDFPWGDGKHTLFHNTHKQPLREGYEEGKPAWYWGSKEDQEEMEAKAKRDSNDDPNVNPTATAGEPFKATEGANPALKFGGQPRYPPFRIPGKPFEAEKINKQLKMDRDLQEEQEAEERRSAGGKK